MSDSESISIAPASEGRSGNVWAHPGMFDGKPVRQLVVPAGVLYAVSGEGGPLEVRNSFGVWPASPVDMPLDDDRLWVRLPLGAKQGTCVKGPDDADGA